MDTEKLINLQKLQLIITLLIFLTVVIGVVIIFIKITPVLETVEVIKQEVQTIDMNELNGAVKSLDAAAENFSRVDTESLNKVVQSINDVTSKLQSVTNALGKLFGG